jgi:hypothetical protein
LNRTEKTTQPEIPRKSNEQDEVTIAVAIDQNRRPIGGSSSSIDGANRTGATRPTGNRLSESAREMTVLRVSSTMHRHGRRTRASQENQDNGTDATA